ncbi:hypothetical protein P692DRAFT_201812519 [Suillus brevipes Sb2]|nr:hypothetical protein P692DRAFT_201812519 [Suillus brevipes Sb2]
MFDEKRDELPGPRLTHSDIKPLLSSDRKKIPGAAIHSGPQRSTKMHPPPTIGPQQPFLRLSKLLHFSPRTNTLRPGRNDKTHVPSNGFIADDSFNAHRHIIWRYTESTTRDYHPWVLSRRHGVKRSEAHIAGRKPVASEQESESESDGIDDSRKPALREKPNTIQYSTIRDPTTK